MVVDESVDSLTWEPEAEVNELPAASFLFTIERAEKTDNFFWEKP